MREPKHTPGPWECHSGRQIGSSTGQVIAICAYGTGLDTHQCHANARLIAFAPELLVALEQMVAEASSHEHMRDRGEVKRARAVLAYVIGETPNQDTKGPSHDRDS